jgi:hypothetical protein
MTMAPFSTAGPRHRYPRSMSFSTSELNRAYGKNPAWSGWDNIGEALFFGFL